LNKQWSDYTGLTAEELTEGTWLQVLHPEDVASHYHTWQRALMTGVDALCEVRLRSKAGVYRWHSILWSGATQCRGKNPAVGQRLYGTVSREGFLLFSARRRKGFTRKVYFFMGMIATLFKPATELTLHCRLEQRFYISGERVGVTYPS
jgi:hypothetical protein